jgi:hypothetical protein
MPVKSPGPMPTAMPPRLRNPSPVWSRQNEIAGIKNSLYEAPRDTTAEAMTPCSEPIATLACGVDVSMPRTST